MPDFERAKLINSYEMRLFMRAADERCAALKAYIEFGAKADRTFPAQARLDLADAHYEAAHTELQNAIDRLDGAEPCGHCGHKVMFVNRHNDR